MASPLTILMISTLFLPQAPANDFKYPYAPLAAIQELDDIIAAQKNVPSDILKTLSNDLSKLVQPVNVFKQLAMKFDSDHRDAHGCGKQVADKMEQIKNEVLQIFSRHSDHKDHELSVEAVISVILNVDIRGSLEKDLIERGVKEQCVKVVLHEVESTKRQWIEEIENVTASNKVLTLEILRDIASGLQSKAYQDRTLAVLLSQRWHNVSQSCVHDLVFWMNGLKSMQQWALKMIDSWGKLEPGLLHGNGYWMGDFDTCVHIAIPRDDGTGGVFMGQMFSFGGQTIPIDRIPQPRVMICMPTTCSNDDMKTLMQDIFSIAEPVDASIWYGFGHPPTETRWMPASKLTSIVFVIILLVVCGLATLYDLILQIIGFIKLVSSAYSKVHSEFPEQAVEKEIPSKATQIILSFSLYSNAKRIMNTTQPKGAITCINGLRFISMTWVLVGHILLFYSKSRIKNPTFLRDVGERLSAQVLFNATVSVDTFFVISGLLVCYLFLKDFQRTNMTVKQFLKSVPLIYLQRYLRLTPAYAAVIMLWTNVYPYIGDGPVWPAQPTFDQTCQKHPYRSLFYINTLFDYWKYQCAGWGWYLSHDFLFFLTTPFVTFLFFRKNLIGSFVILGMISGSIVIFAVQCYQYHIHLHDGTAERDSFKGVPKHLYIDKHPVYFSPWNRFQSYGVGMAAGMILWKIKNKELNLNLKHLVFSLGGWLVAFVLAMSVVYGPYDAWRQWHEVSLPEAATYRSFARTVWSISIAYLIIACYLGYGGYINEFLSWKAFVPLSRLTYCTYLIHLTLVFSINAAKRDGEFYTELTVFQDCLFIGVLAIGLSFPYSLVFEMPYVELERILLRPFTLKKTRLQEKPKENVAAQNGEKM